MPNNIPNTIFRPIQVEETTGTDPFSEFLTQGIGGNNNYIKAQVDKLNQEITDYYANGAISIAAVAFTGTSFPSPNGKAWYIVWLAPVSGPSAIDFFHPIIAGYTNYYYNSNTMTNATASIGGPNVLASGGSWAGYGFYQS